MEEIKIEYGGGLMGGERIRKPLPRGVELQLCYLLPEASTFYNLNFLDVFKARGIFNSLRV